MRAKVWLAAAAAAGAMAMAAPAAAQPAGGPALVHIDRGISLPWTILLVLTVLTLLPAILLAMTPFVRILIVFSFLRQAIGTTTTPSNQTLVGLALILTYFVMAPVGAVIEKTALVPLEDGKITPWTAVQRSAVPMKHFMLRYARESDLGLFVNLAHLPRPKAPEDLPMRVVVPAYLLSELKTGFQIGAVLFLPFLVIDMVVASVTTSIGMMQLPPVVISTPLKILLFVSVNGWGLVVGSLMKSFN